MKSNKSIPSAKDGKTAKVTPVTQGSPSVKATPGNKNAPAAKVTPSAGGSQNSKTVPVLKSKPAKVLTPGAAAPQDQATPDVPAPVVHSAAEVALRAYHNFQKRGSAEGNHTDDWLRAEAELASERRLVRS